MINHHFGSLLLTLILSALLASCSESTTNQEATDAAAPAAPQALLPTDETVNPGDLLNYAEQFVPDYIRKDNTGVNSITDGGATLGRVLFYDRNLSSNNTVSCASCHQQAAGFSDTRTTSPGVNGETSRHSMRLVNTRFADEPRFFWDERAATLEEQTTQPIRDHGEMGFSGLEGDPDFAQLLVKLGELSYYPDLFVSAFGNSVITEDRMQNALAQFIRSIQSFDSRYDQGRALVDNEGADFPNFTAQENEGKRLFTQRRDLIPATNQRVPGSGLGCNACHRAPEFDIDPGSRNNGMISVVGNPLGFDTTITRSPSLRDLFSASGSQNGAFMHDGSLASFNDVLDHYNAINVDRLVNTNLDNRLSAGGGRQNGQAPTTASGQQLLLTDEEREAVTAFVKTLSGQALYTDERWSDPFDGNGNLNQTR